MKSSFPARAALALGVVALIVAGLAYLKGPPAKPNVIVLLLDTLRADHVRVYGYERETTPNLDKFARENLFFRSAYTAAPWTPPSVATIFTGLYSSSHGMMPPNGREAAKEKLSKLPATLATISEVLKASGYKTLGVSSNPWITDGFGYTQGFDSFVYTNRSRADRVSAEGLKAIEGAGGDPFFAYLHFLDPHDPYDPPKDFRFEGTLQNASYPEKTAARINLYDGEIKYLDDQIGKLFAELKARGLYDDALIVVVGDHGEQFMERGNQGHGFQLFNEETHVPLFVKVPKGDRREVSSVVSTIDIFPTILEVVGIPRPSYLHGVSLLDEKALAERRGVMTEIRRKFLQRGYINSDGKKLILGSADEKSVDGGEEALDSVVGIFDSRSERIERTRVEDPGLLQELKSELYDVARLAVSGQLKTEGDTAAVGEDTIEQLKSLGYLGQ